MLAVDNDLSGVMLSYGEQVQVTTVLEKASAEVPFAGNKTKALVRGVVTIAGLTYSFLACLQTNCDNVAWAAIYHGNIFAGTLLPFVAEMAVDVLQPRRTALERRALSATALLELMLGITFSFIYVFLVCECCECA